MLIHNSDDGAWYLSDTLLSLSELTANRTVHTLGLQTCFLTIVKKMIEKEPKRLKLQTSRQILHFSHISIFRIISPQPTSVLKQPSESLL